MIEPMTYDYHKQCLTCNLSEHLRELADTWTGSFEGLKRELFNNHGIAISADALSNHKRFHADQQQVNLEEDTGSQEGIVDIDGVRYYKRLKKQWQLNTGEWRRSYEFIPVETTEQTLDFKSTIDHLTKVESKFEATFQPLIKKRRQVVVHTSDWQIGKVDSLGDSNTLIERVKESKDRVEDYIKDSGATTGVYADTGDIVEGFENTGAQAHTNDLSFVEQLELGILLTQDFVFGVASVLEHVDVATVPSNHAAWRRGKDYLGKPGDDFGLHILRQVERIAKMSDSISDRMTFHLPNPWDKSLSLDMGSEILGLTHGDDVNSPDQIPKWFASQVNGGTALAETTLLLTGHFHSTRIQTIGTQLNGKEKWWIQSKALDNGSAWFKNKAGVSEEPGVTVFCVDDDKGFDIGSLEIL